MTDNLYSLSISARATLDLHSLNNEGGEGNQIQTRMVNIVDQTGRLQNVNAISGDMYKHIQSDHLIRRALDAGLPVCEGCRKFNANRINEDPQFNSFLGEKIRGPKKNEIKNKYDDPAVLNYIIENCVVDDLAGILVTSGGQSDAESSANHSDDAGTKEQRSKKRSLPRKSVIEFGWVVGLPDAVSTDSYFHVKYANDRSEGKRKEDRNATESTGSNLGQAIFYRPASSGVYAAICHIDFARIGFNDITQTYAIDATQRAARAKVLLESVLFTFIEPNGAMRTTQAPHLVNFEGVISFSNTSIPAPNVSPLKDSFVAQVNALANVLNELQPGAVGTAAFGDLSEFGGILTQLMTWHPYAHHYSK